jgi:hypothetical protein
MVAQAEGKNASRWESPDYDRIERARYDEETRLLTVEFADGTVVSLDPESIMPSPVNEPDWWRTASNSMEIIVPHDEGWTEIPWDVIRRATDPEFLAHWESFFQQSDQAD